MARPLSERKSDLIKFKETELYLNGSIGGRTSSLTKVSSKEVMQSRKSALLGDLEYFCEYMDKNPFEIVEYAKQALANPELLGEFREKVEGFPRWLIDVKRLAESTSNTRYGNVRGFLRWNNAKVTVKNYAPKSQKAKVMDEAGLKFEDIFKVAKDIYTYGKCDVEMKAFMVLALNSGLRISDIARIPFLEMKNKLAKNEEFIVLKAPTYKIADVDYLAILHRITQQHLRKYLDTISDNRTCLFGKVNPDGSQPDPDNTEYRIASRLENLYRAVIKEFYPQLQGKGKKTTTKAKIKKNEGRGKSFITPHTFRAFFETILGKHGVDRAKIHRMDGHKPDNLAVYDLDSDVFQQIIKACEKDLTFEGIDLSMKTEEEIKLNFAKQLVELLNNQGKLETILHRVDTLGEDDTEITPEDNVENEMAVLVNTLCTIVEKRIMEKLGIQQ